MCCWFSIFGESFLIMRPNYVNAKCFVLHATIERAIGSLFYSKKKIGAGKAIDLETMVFNELSIRALRTIVRDYVVFFFNMIQSEMCLRYLCKSRQEIFKAEQRHVGI